MADKIFIIGAGLHAKVCIDIAEKQGLFEICGLIDSRAEIGSKLYGYTVIGRQESIAELSKEYSVNKGFIAIGENYNRSLVYNEIISRKPEFTFVSLVHPSAILGKNIVIGEGTVLMAGVIINSDAVVGNHCILNTGSQLEHNSEMYDFAHLSAGSITGGKVVLKKYCLVTLNVTIVDRVTIGENSVIGSGSLVLRDVPDNVLAFGSPAVVVKERKLTDKVLK